MANIKSAKKRARQAEARRERNVSARSAVRTQVKTCRNVKVIESGDIKVAGEVLRKTASVLDKAAQKRLIHPNKAARLKSRLNKKIKSLVLGFKEKASAAA